MSFFSLDIECKPDFVEILMAELAELGFSTFQEKEDGNGLNAYADEGFEVDERSLAQLLSRYTSLADLKFQQSFVEKENWNADWEKNYDPITVENKIRVRADFHEASKDYELEIVVIPKMSFGTGHHETTHQLLDLLFDCDLKGKKVLDAGCGTGILAILAYLRGAESVHAYDIDEWAIENTFENFGLNDLTAEKYEVWKGDVFSIAPENRYDIIIANINRNILLNDIPELAKHLQPGGKLFLSGFYKEDINDILSLSAQHGLEEDKQRLKNNWAALMLQKKK